MSNSEEEKLKPVVEKLIDIGSEIAGDVASTAIRFLIPGLEGVLIAPLLTRTFLYIGAEIKSRVLGPREQVRIGATIAFAIKKVQENLANGQKIRQGDFFQERPGERAAAKEIVEGVLLAAQREHEEKKIRFYGNLVANIAFHPEINRAQANLLIRLCERISYRQMRLLALFARKDQFTLRQGSYLGLKLDITLLGLVQEIYDLYIQGMLTIDANVLNLWGINPAKTNIAGIGILLHDLMELQELDIQELIPLIRLLQM